MKCLTMASLCGVVLMLVSYSASGTNFYKESVPSDLQQKMIVSGLWKETCPVPLDRMAMLHLSYYDFDGKIHDDGQMIVMDAAGSHVLNIFKKLYAKKFPIKSIKLTSDYGGNDELSMEDNNTSAFNCRKVTGGSIISMHAYGLAIDVNPVMNPFVVLNREKETVDILPSLGLDYLNRVNKRSGMAEPIVSIFEKEGFSKWGGSWNDPIDWQHFQTPRALAERLTTMMPEEAKKCFDKHVRHQ